MELVNDITKKWLDAFIAKPKVSAIIETQNDSTAGIQAAKYIYTSLVNTSRVPYFSVCLKDKKSISIEDARELKSYLKLKANIDDAYTSFVAIHSAEHLTPEAQNALLKIIEELPERTILVLIVNDCSKILETINSRCHKIKILPIEHHRAKNFARKHDIGSSIFERYFLISEGKATLFSELIKGDSKAVEYTLENVKMFLKSDVFSRQKLIIDYTKNDFNVLHFIKIIQLVAKSSMRLTVKIENKLKWKKVLENSIEAENKLNNNVNSKLVMLDLSVSV